MFESIRVTVIAIVLSLSAVTLASEAAADGGDPGAALLRHFAAIDSGDAERIKAETHPAEHAMLDEAIAAGEFGMLIGMMQAMMPRNISLQGATVDGDTAELAFTGDLDGEPVRGKASLGRVDDAWRVSGVSFSH
jgi:hypothetical protein